MPPRHVNFHGYKSTFRRQTIALADPWSPEWEATCRIKARQCKQIMGVTEYGTWLSSLPGGVDGYSHKQLAELFDAKIKEFKS